MIVLIMNRVCLIYSCKRDDRCDISIFQFFNIKEVGDTFPNYFIKVKFRDDD